MDQKHDLDSYLIKKSINSREFGNLVLFNFFLPDGNIIDEIYGREVFLFDENGEVIWQIFPENFSTESDQYVRREIGNYIFITDIIYNIFNGRFYAIRTNGERFIIEMKNGYAKFDGWQRG